MTTFFVVPLGLITTTRDHCAVLDYHVSWLVGTWAVRCFVITGNVQQESPEGIVTRFVGNDIIGGGHHQYSLLKL